MLNRNDRFYNAVMMPVPAMYLQRHGLTLLHPYRGI